MDRCMKCWRLIVQDGKKTRKLWCDRCRYYVDKEIRWESCRAFRFYFEYRIKRKQDRKLEKESD